MNLVSEVELKHHRLIQHPMYKSLVTLNNIRMFMKYHVFAVWDFMSLLKSLQKEITCVNVPWTESLYDTEFVRLINEIVIAEESDLDLEGNPISHFSLYIKAMKEISADTSLILNFIKDFNLNSLPQEIRNMLIYHLDLAQNGKVHEVASSFFYGREKLIPEMFQSIVEVIKSSNLSCPNLIYYLDRHIELDGEDHGPKALRCLSHLLNSENKVKEALSVARKSLEFRWELWEFIQQEISARRA